MGLSQRILLTRKSPEQQECHSSSSHQNDSSCCLLTSVCLQGLAQFQENVQLNSYKYSYGCVLLRGNLFSAEVTTAVTVLLSQALRRRGGISKHRSEPLWLGGTFHGALGFVSGSTMRGILQVSLLNGKVHSSFCQHFKNKWCALHFRSHVWVLEQQFFFSEAKKKKKK